MELLRQAYAKLGLDETATMEQVENKYFLLLRREKARLNKLSEPYAIELDAEAIQFAEITTAYQFIKQNQFTVKIQTEYPEENAKSRLRINFDYYWEYYKVHAFVGIILVLLIGFIIQGVLNNQREKAIEAAKPPIDVWISIFGEYYFNTTEPDFTSIENAVKAKMTTWQRVKVNFVYSPIEPRDSYDLAFQQKSIISLATDKPDLYIMDEGNFAKLSYTGLFYPLSLYESELRALLGEERLIYSETDEFPTRQLYGIDISESAIFDGVDINDQKKIIAIRVDATQTDKSIALLKKIAESLKK